jgi:hypothetical protein
MPNERLNSLALLSIENVTVQTVDKTLADMKARKKNF